MGPYFVVFAGAGLGGVARHAVNVIAGRLGYAFPLGTLAVNVVGSFLMGVLAAWFAQRSDISQHMRFFLTTGVLGGFTTFSAFSLETLALIQSGRWGTAAGYVASSVAVCVTMTAVGYAAVRR